LLALLLITLPITTSTCVCARLGRNSYPARFTFGTQSSVSQGQLLSLSYCTLEWKRQTWTKSDCADLPVLHRRAWIGSSKVWGVPLWRIFYFQNDCCLGRELLEKLVEWSAADIDRSMSVHCFVMLGGSGVLAECNRQSVIGRRLQRITEGSPLFPSPPAERRNRSLGP
jgi:hypothetical protein